MRKTKNIHDIENVEVDDSNRTLNITTFAQKNLQKGHTKIHNSSQNELLGTSQNYDQDKSYENDNYNINVSQNDDVYFTSDEIRDRILNEKNIPITEDYINGIFKRLNFDHRVKNLENFQLAMIHSSYLEENIYNPKTIKLLKDIPPIDQKFKKICMPLCKKSYERLEYLGDSVIRHAIGKYLFLRYPDEEEGFLTTNRSKMENTKALSNFARKFGIQNYAVIARNIELANGRTTYVTLTEDIFEAFVGAFNLETDDNKAIEFVWAIIEQEGDVAETIRTQNNYKDQLMQYFHKVDVVKHELRYDDVELETEDGRRRFRTVVIDKYTQKRLGVGSGRSKKTSQQRAAKDALIKLGLIGNDKEEIEYFDIDNIDDISKEIDKVRSHVDECFNSDDDQEYDISLLDLVDTQNKIEGKSTQLIKNNNNNKNSNIKKELTGIKGDHFTESELCGVKGSKGVKGDRFKESELRGIKG